MRLQQGAEAIGLGVDNLQGTPRDIASVFRAQDLELRGLLKFTVCRRDTQVELS